MLISENVQKAPALERVTNAFSSLRANVTGLFTRTPQATSSFSESSLESPFVSTPNVFRRGWNATSQFFSAQWSRIPALSRSQGTESSLGSGEEGLSESSSDSAPNVFRRGWNAISQFFSAQWSRISAPSRSKSTKSEPESLELVDFARQDNNSALDGKSSSPLSEPSSDSAPNVFRRGWNATSQFLGTQFDSIGSLLSDRRESTSFNGITMVVVSSQSTPEQASTTDIPSYLADAPSDYLPSRANGSIYPSLEGSTGVSQPHDYHGGDTTGYTLPSKLTIR